MFEVIGVTFGGGGGVQGRRGKCPSDIFYTWEWYGAIELKRDKQKNRNIFKTLIWVV